MKNRLINLSITLALCLSFAFILSYMVESLTFFGDNFPSHHTLYAFCVALSMLSFSNRYGLVACIIALAIAVWRVIGGYHSLFEVIGGFAIAIMSMFCVLLIYSLASNGRMLKK
jgi:membrane-associated phospholipid phosphatase